MVLPHIEWSLVHVDYHVSLVSCRNNNDFLYAVPLVVKVTINVVIYVVLHKGTAFYYIRQ